jgi:transcriptional regulator
MSIGSQTLSDKRRTKELKVLQLHEQGYTYRKIASIIHLSLRDVTKFIHRISNNTKSPSTTSLMDEVVLEYRVNGLKHQVRDLRIEKDTLMNEVTDLRAQKYNLQIQVCARQAELDAVKRNLECEKFSRELVNDNFIEDKKLH